MMIMRCRLVFIGVVLGFALLSVPSYAGLFSDSEARDQIKTLQQKLNATAKTQREVNGSVQSQILNIKLFMDAQQEIIRSLKGDIEELKNSNANLKRQHTFLMEQMTATKDNLQSQITEAIAANAKNNTEVLSIGEQKYTVAPNDAAMYRYVMSDFQAGNYSNAALFLKFANALYPQSALKPLRAYWLANSYYAGNKCNLAIPAFKNYVKEYPQQAQSPDAMFNLALCQRQLKRKKSAKSTLKSLIETYADSSAAAKAQQQLALWEKEHKVKSRRKVKKPKK